MNLALEDGPIADAGAESGVHAASSFLEVNLESLRIPPETRATVLASEPRGHIALLEDGTAYVQVGADRLGMPLAPAEIFRQLSGMDEQHVVVIFGIGTGQVARAVRAMCRAPIVVYEPDPAVLRTLLSYGPLDLGNTVIACGIADLTRAWREFAMRLIDVRVMTTPGYYRAYPEAVREFVETVPALLQRTAISKATYQNRARVWVQDVIENVDLLQDAPPFLTLTGRYAGVPAFIVGAGPSLDRNIRELSRAAQHGIVFATNSGAVSLAAHGIEPQVVVCIESIDASSKLRDLPFIDRAVRAFSLSAAPTTLRTGRGPLLPVHEAVPQYSGPLEELTLHGGLPMSGSVSTVAFSLARVLGCSPIVLVGQDLAYSDGRTYATGTGYEASTAKVNPVTGVIDLRWNDEILRVHGAAQGAPRHQEELRRVPAWGGQGDVDSGLGFAGVHAWFESTAALMEKAGSGARLINATEGGVSIKGYEELPLGRVLDTLVPRQLSAESISRDAREAWTPITRARIQSWLESHAQATRRVRRAARRLRRYGVYAGRVTAQGAPRLVTEAYDRMERAESELRVAVVLCPLVDAWSHRAIDEALLGASPSEATSLPSTSVDAHADAKAATQKSSRVASAVEQSARELEAALLDAAARLSTEPSQLDS
jgi:hypothetical protein